MRLAPVERSSSAVKGKKLATAANSVCIRESKIEFLVVAFPCGFRESLWLFLM